MFTTRATSTPRGLSLRSRLRRAIAGSVVAVTAVAGVGVAATPAHAEGAVTGGSNFSNIVLELPQGGNVNDIYAMHFMNNSNAPVQAQFQWSAPYGITLTARKTDFVLNPGQKADAPFNIAIADDTPGGEYKVTTGIFRRDVTSEPDKVVFVPGITQSFTIRVLGDAAVARLSVIDKYKRQPVSGLVSVARVQGSVRTEIARRLADKFDLRAVPGQYEASVFIDGRRVALRNFSLVKDQTIDVVIEVEAIFIQDVALLPRKSDGKLQTIEVTATVQNSLRPLPQATLLLEVLRNNKTLETLEMQKFSPLEAGPTSAGVRYVPKDGWKPGRYTFVVRLEAPEFTVKASNQPSYTIGGPMRSLFGWILGALGLLVLIVAVVIAIRRRKRDKQAGASGHRRAAMVRPAQDAPKSRTS